MLRGVRQQGLDSLEHLAARRPQVPVGGRAAHQHEHVGAQLGGLLDGPAVVLLALAPGRCAGGGEEPTAAQTGHLEAGVGDSLGGPG